MAHVLTPLSLLAFATAPPRFAAAFSILSLMRRSPRALTCGALSSMATSSSESDVTQQSAASAFSGAGPIQVDMNMYNLPFDRVYEQWTAIAVPATPLKEEGIYLSARDSDNIMVDTVKVEFPRLPDTGLGIQLLELAGGRDDGVGITLIDNLVPGGCAEKSGVLPGDSLVKVEVRRSSRSTNDSGALQDATEEFSVGTECLGYDATVEAISSLPACASGDEMFVVTLKRLRRKPKVRMNLQYPPEQNEPDIKIELFSGENLRRAMLVRGVKLNDKLSARFDSGGTGDCGAEGTCATCAVDIVQGDRLLSPRGQQEGQIFQRQSRRRLACKAIVGYGMQEGEITVRVNPRQWQT